MKERGREGEREREGGSEIRILHMSTFQCILNNYCGKYKQKTY